MKRSKKEKVIYYVKAVLYFALHIPATLLFSELYLRYSYFPLDVGSSADEAQRISEIIFVLSYLLVIIRMIITAKRRRWIYIIINSMTSVVFYNILVFICYVPFVAFCFTISATCLTALALYSLFGGKRNDRGSARFRKKLRTVPLIVTNIFILMFGIITIWPVFTDGFGISMGRISAEYENEITNEEEGYEDVIRVFQDNENFKDLTIEEKLEIVTYITAAESEYYGVLTKPTVQAEMMDTAVFASTNFKKNEITFNKAYLSKTSKEGLLCVTLHEMGHVYGNNLILMFLTQIKDGDFENLLVFDEIELLIKNKNEYITPREDIEAYNSQYSEEFAENKAKERYEFYRELIGSDYIGEYPL